MFIAFLPYLHVEVLEQLLVFPVPGVILAVRGVQLAL